MNGIILGLLAETAVHPGAGQSEGAIDLPVARERTTGYPVLAASGVKGALRDRAERDGVSGPDRDRLYGKADQGGALIVSDGRLLLLPVRSLTSAYCWVTCPHLIERLQRDRVRLGIGEVPGINLPGAWSSDDGVPIAVVGAARPSHLFLEELVFRPQPEPELIEAVAGLVRDLIGDAFAQARLARQLTIVGDDVFAEFARYALAVDAHNSLDDNKVSTALWYEETIPSDTVMYALVLDRTGGGELKRHFDALFFDPDKPYLQLGGNETTGQGWFRVARVTSQ